MKRRQKRTKPSSLVLAPINRDLEPSQLELPYLEMSPMETVERPELPEIALKPINVDLQETSLDDKPD